MRIAIYCRKSVYSDKSDSVDNQERMCRDFAEMKFQGQINSIEVYQDEGFSGANIDRPGMERLLVDIKNNQVNALIVYQLDRISRDVRDFSNIYALLEEKQVMFLSIKENIDTSTPIGKAMTMITMVFAQMERETIANRITDNMIGLAKKGYWTGGNPPYGYVRQKIVVDGKKHVTIIPDPEASQWVESIYDSFIDNEYSLSGMETAFKRARIRTPSGSFFSATQLYKLLTMPFCAPTTQAVRDYWISQGCRVEGSESDWDGKHGVMVYGRTTEKHGKHSLQPRSEWIVCPGMHKPFLSEQKWLSAQSQFQQNIIEKVQKYDTPLLKGVLRCAKCGCIMSISRKKTKTGVTSHYYCRKRMRQGKEVCDMRFIKCDLLDSEVISIFRQIEADPETVQKYAGTDKTTQATSDIASINRQIASCDARIAHLTASLAESDNSTARKYIVAEIERQDLNLSALKRDLEIAKAKQRDADLTEQSLTKKTDEIKKLISGLSGFSDIEKNRIAKEVIKECTWDGETLFIKL